MHGQKQTTLRNDPITNKQGGFEAVASGPFDSACLTHPPAIVEIAYLRLSRREDVG